MATINLDLTAKEEELLNKLFTKKQLNEFLEISIRGQIEQHIRSNLGVTEADIQKAIDSLK